MKKKISILLGLILTCGILVYGQAPRKGFSPKDFIKNLESFIVCEACLTPSEATAFFPIYHEMHSKQRSIEWEIRDLRKRKLPANSTDKDYLQLIKEINKLKIKSAELEETYYKKMCKAISAQKVHAAMQAENKFHRRMLRKFSDRQAPPKR